MIYEKLNIKVDVQALRDHLQNTILCYPAVDQSKDFGGWSILSSDGTYTDGWVQGHSCFEEVDGKLKFDHQKAKALGLKSIEKYDRPTEICTGYMAEVIDTIKAMKLYPCRARISRLSAMGQSSLHRDGGDNDYAVRLHIPIITNPLATFECDSGKVHMPADGSVYVLRVNRLHQVINKGSDDRYHLIMNIFDFYGSTRYHRWDRPLPKVLLDAQ